MSVDIEPTAAIAEQRDERTALYRLYDADGMLLYVGIARNPERRFAQHAAEKTWWPRVVRRAIEWYETRGAALMAEEAAIKIDRPTQNIDHNPLAPETVPVELPGEFVIGLDILRRDFITGHPNCSRYFALLALLGRELAARGLLGGPRCVCDCNVPWPDGLESNCPCVDASDIMAALRRRRNGEQS